MYQAQLVPISEKPLAGCTLCKLLRSIMSRMQSVVFACACVGSFEGLRECIFEKLTAVPHFIAVFWLNMLI
jgi:hypothetical protein